MEKQKLRVIFDSNVYGTMVEENLDSLFKKIELSKNIIVYGANIIRKELRNTPKRLLHGRKNFRGILLYQYDSLVKDHELEINQIVEAIAVEYAKNYRGGISKQQLKNDFLIVACASLHHLDIIVTGDKHSMFAKNAVAAYQKVNEQNDLRTPNFHSIEEMEKLL
ncbi:MAG: hypothetical protein Q7S21_02765 [archaeon]|nr:hypothetical protein [archaeon]